MSKIFKINENVANYSPNYLATICKIGEVFPIEGADRLVKTVINGYDIVIGKDNKPGDIVVYFPVETSICGAFLSANNLYERPEFERNSNAEETKELIVKAENASTDEERANIVAEIKSKCGFFGKHGRVRILKLRGQYSQGFICGIESMVKYDASLADVKWEDLVGTQFNEVNGNEFCWKYVPATKEVRSGGGSDRAWRKRMKHIARFDRLIDGQFAFHYSTQMLNEHADVLSPDDIVTISTKRHGTSVIIANVLCNRKLSAWEKIKKFFGLRVVEKEYGNIYSSRSVIKNRYLNKDTHDYYGTDIWGCVNRDFGPYLDKGMTIYGEIVGYTEGTQKMIQKSYDYGCREGQWKFMPYRITITDENGDKTEWNVAEVDAWVRKLVGEHPELSEKTLFMDIRYHGRIGDLYPDLDESQHWHENLLAKMKCDTTHFDMEKNDPLCKNKVPYEGIVIRIDNDKFARAFKLKCQAFYSREAKQHDEGQTDIEETS